MEGILCGEAIYFKYLRKIIEAENIDDLKDIEYEIIEDESPYFSAVAKRVWEAYSQKENELSTLEQEIPENDASKLDYEIGNTVIIEGREFVIEEISDREVQLRDPKLFYPIFRAESRTNFERLLSQEKENILTKPDPKSSFITSTKDADKPNASNFRITEDFIGNGTLKEKYRKNIEAICALKKIEDENRSATWSEQKILSHYVGWGGLADAFDERKTAWAGEYHELKNLLSEEEYASTRASTLNAHYTSLGIIRCIYDTLENMGYEKGNLLEPALGIGNFYGCLPEKMRESRLYGVELDKISDRIAKQIYPNASIKISGFEKTDYPDDFFDVAVGNVPFGEYRISVKKYDKNIFSGTGLFIHDYFFMKTLDKVRPGGVVAFVTSKGTSMR